MNDVRFFDGGLATSKFMVLKASSKRGVSFGPGHIFHRESRKVGIEYYGYYWLLLVTTGYYGLLICLILFEIFDIC